MGAGTVSHTDARRGGQAQETPEHRVAGDGGTFAFSSPRRPYEGAVDRVVVVLGTRAPCGLATWVPLAAAAAEFLLGQKERPALTPGIGQITGHRRAVAAS